MPAGELVPPNPLQLPVRLRRIRQHGIGVVRQADGEGAARTRLLDVLDAVTTHDFSTTSEIDGIPGAGEECEVGKTAIVVVQRKRGF